MFSWEPSSLIFFHWTESRSKQSDCYHGLQADMVANLMGLGNQTHLMHEIRAVHFLNLMVIKHFFPNGVSGNFQEWTAHFICHIQPFDLMNIRALNQVWVQKASSILDQVSLHSDANKSHIKSLISCCSFYQQKAMAIWKHLLIFSWVWLSPAKMTATLLFFQ